MRLGLGPVFAYERLIEARRWQTYAARSVMVTALLAAVVTIAQSHQGDVNESVIQRYARLGESYFIGLIGVELALVMLAAPAATAGAICLDRARGTLAHIMATDLSDSEIVIGKFAARILPVFGLVACTWPVMAICSLLGGIDPTALILAFAIIAAVALLGCAIALTLSVWAKKPHEVILATYFFWLVSLMAWPTCYALALAGVVPMAGSSRVLLINPFYLACAPYWAPGFFDFSDYVCFYCAAIVISTGLVSLAVWRMREVACRQAGEGHKDPGLGWFGRIGRWLPGPSLDGNPVLWREWHRARPSRWMTFLIVVLGGATSLACCVGAVSAWRDGVGSGHALHAQAAGVFGYLIQVAFGLLVLSVLAPLSLSEERQRGSLDLLAITPQSSAAIVLGKWWGMFRLVPVLSIAPGLVAFALASARLLPRPASWGNMGLDVSRGQLIGGAVLFVATILAHGAAITSMGLVLATWIKRPFRAITVSVSLAVIVSVAWPIVAVLMFRNPQRLAFLSPIVAVGALADELTLRLDRLSGMLWWVGFWDASVTALAIGLLWLTWRTFDLGLERIPERGRKWPIFADVIVVLGATTAVSGFYMAVTILRLGISSHSLNPLERDGVALYVLSIAVGLLMIAAFSPLSIAFASSRNRAVEPSSFIGPSHLAVVDAWGQSFRLLVLLMLGPILIALAVALAPRSQSALVPGVGRSIAASKPIAGAGRPIQPGVVVPSIVTEISFRKRLWTVAFLTATLLSHGALAISAGLALGICITRRSWAVAASIGVFLLAHFALLLLDVRASDPLIFSGVVCVDLLFTQLLSREPQLLGVDGWPALLSSMAANLLLALLLFWLTTFVRGRWRRRQDHVRYAPHRPLVEPSSLSLDSS